MMKNKEGRKQREEQFYVKNKKTKAEEKEDTKSRKKRLGKM